MQNTTLTTLNNQMKQKILRFSPEQMNIPSIKAFVEATNELLAVTETAGLFHDERMKIFDDKLLKMQSCQKAYIREMLLN